MPYAGPESLEVIQPINVVKEEGSGIGEAVHSIEYAAVTRKQTAAVLNLQVAFQSREVDVTYESSDPYYQPGNGGLPSVEHGEEWACLPRDDGRGGHSSQKAGPSLSRTDFRQYFPSPE